MGQFQPQVQILFKNQDQKKIFFKCLLNLPLHSAILHSDVILILIKFLYAWKDGELFWNLHLWI